MAVRVANTMLLSSFFRWIVVIIVRSKNVVLKRIHAEATWRHLMPIIVIRWGTIT